MKRRLSVFGLVLLAVFALSACEGEEGPDKEYDIKVTSNIEEFDYSLNIEGNTMTLSLESHSDNFSFVHWYEPDTYTVLSEEETFEKDLYSEEMTIQAVFEFTGTGGVEGDFTGDESFETLLSYGLDDYYQGADGLYGDDLDDALTTILNEGVTTLSYDDAKWVLEESDEDPDNPENIILVYTRESVKGEWDFPNWNREHVWPQSKLGDADAKADVHHLKPSDVQENSNRGSLPFGEGDHTYEPPDEVKGDVARMVFYMDARYDDLNLEHGALGDLGLLLEWHVEDPVDEFELNRNNVLYDHQGNRNPFIDHPHLAYLMFYDHPSLDLD